MVVVVDGGGPAGGWASLCLHRRVLYLSRGHTVIYAGMLVMAYVLLYDINFSTINASLLNHQALWDILYMEECSLWPMFSTIDSSLLNHQALWDILDMGECSLWPMFYTIDASLLNHQALWNIFYIWGNARYGLCSLLLIHLY